VKKRFFILIILLLFCLNLNAQVLLPAAVNHPSDGQPVSHALSACVEMDCSRTIGVNLYQRSIYRVLFFDSIFLNAGISLSATPFSVDGYFLAAGVENLLGTGVWAGVKLMGDQYPEYSRALNSINVYLGWIYWWFDAAVGIHWRYLVVDPRQIYNIFFLNDFHIERHLYFRVGVNIPFAEDFYTFSFSITNHDSFYAGNFDAFMFGLGNRFCLGENLNASADIIFRPTGTIAYTAAWASIIFKAGIEWEI